MDKDKSKEGEKDIIFIDNALNPEEALTKFSFKGKTIKEIIESVENNIKFDTFFWKKESNNNIFLRSHYNRDVGIIFANSIEVKYELFKNSKSESVEYVQKNVYSTVQIDDFLKNNEITSPTFELNNKTNNYASSKSLLRSVDKSITLVSIKYEYSLVENCELLNNDVFIKKEILSKYFDDYFMYPKNIDAENVEFTYYESKNRRDLNCQLEFFHSNPNLSKFKITGPSNKGKSTTLLYFSRTSYNIVYLNLKSLKTLYKNENYAKILDILMYEFGRIKFTEDQKTLFEQTFNENKKKTYVELIEKICLFLKKESIQATLIFDQFKAKNIHFSDYSDITSFFDINLKIIISSSINDKDIGSEVIKTFNKFKGNPTTLDIDTQDYYFYYCDLIDPELFKEKYNDEKYSFFNYNPKYIAKLKDKTLGEIKEHILNKMRYNSDAYGIKLEIYLFNIYRSVNIDLSFKDNLSIMNMISLKYCKLLLKDNDIFQIKYGFNLVEIIVYQEIKKINTQDYFKNKLYKENELYGKMKGDIFEFSVCNYFKEIKDELFNTNIGYIINLRSIVDMTLDDKSKEIYEEYKNIIEYKDPDQKEEENLNLVNSKLESFENQDNIETTSKDKKDINYYKKEAFINEKKNLLGKKSKREEKKEEKNKTKSSRTTKSKSDNKTKKKEFIQCIKVDQAFQDGGILLNQTNMNGKTLDLGFLFGENNNKTFVDIQIKFYGEGSTLKATDKPTKSSIKDKFQKILVSCYENMQITIKQWHYVFCMYINEKDDDFQYNKSLKEDCEKADLEYVFYNPNSKLLYDRSFNVINQIKLNYRTNLDNNWESNPYVIFKDNGYLEAYSLQREKLSTHISEKEFIFKKSKKEILALVEKILPSSHNYQCDIVCKFKFETKFHAPSPNNSYLFIFQGNDNGNILYYYYNIDNQFKAGELIKNNNLLPIEIYQKKDFGKESMFYVIKIEKIEKIEKINNDI